MYRKQFFVSKAINGAILELVDVDTKQRLPIINHPKLQGIRHFLGSGVAVIGWNEDTQREPGTRWINTILCMDQPYKVIDVHGPWNDRSQSPFIGDAEDDIVAILNEDWFSHPDVPGGAFWEIKW
jgi:hypothetical protein